MADVYGLLQEYGALIIIALGLGLMMLYLYSHISRIVSYMKMKVRNEGHEEIIENTYTFVRFIGVIYLLLLILLVGGWLHITNFDEVLGEAGNYLFIMMGIVTFFTFMTIAQLITVWISVYRMEAASNPEAMLKPGILEFYEVFAKYSLIILGLAVSLFVAILTMPSEAVRYEFFEMLGLHDPSGVANARNSLISLVLILLVIYLVYQLVSTMLNDFKKKSTKFPPRLVDLIKTFLRYLLYWLSFVISLMVILGIIGFPYIEMVILIIVAITLAFVLIIGFSPATKNAISGISLLLTESINKGDWVKFGDETTGEVLEQNLIFTRLRTQEGDVMDIPNHRVLDGVVHNYTTIDGLRLDMDVAISVETPSEVIEETIRGACVGIGGIDPKYEINVRLTSFDRDSAVYKIHVWVLDPAEADGIRSLLMKSFKTNLAKKGISLGSLNLRQI